VGSEEMLLLEGILGEKTPSLWSKVHKKVLIVTQQSNNTIIIRNEGNSLLSIYELKSPLLALL
jgi:hypothetical protein